MEDLREILRNVSSDARGESATRDVKLSEASRLPVFGDACERNAWRGVTQHEGDRQKDALVG